MTDEFKIKNNVKSYEEVINSSFLNPQTKKEYISHLKLYENYIAEKNRSEIINSYKENREACLLNLYSPDNAWEYIINNKNLSDSTKKRRLKIFLNIFRKATSDASLIYTNNFPKNIKSKLKHFITDEEILNYTNYLKNKGLFESLLIIELLYKFGFRIGALAKIKVKNLSNDNNLVLLEKNSEIIKKKLLENTANKIRNLIKVEKATKNEHIFFPKKFPNDDNKRTKFLSAYIKNTMVNSGAFPINEFESISAHCFRATLAVKKYKEGGAISAQKALNHKNVGTTLSHYIKVNEREIDINEENNYINNNKIKASFDFSNKNNQNYCKDVLIEESEESEDSNSIISLKKDETIEEKLFSLCLSNQYKKENKKFLNIFFLLKNEYL